MKFRLNKTKIHFVLDSTFIHYSQQIEVVVFVVVAVVVVVDVLDLDLDLDLDIFQNQNKVHTTKQIDLYKDISTIDHS